MADVFQSFLQSVAGSLCCCSGPLFWPLETSVPFNHQMPVLNLFSCNDIVCNNHYVSFIQALAEAKKRIEELEKKLLENVPIDTAKEIGAYQEKMVSAKKYLWKL